jgi:hypothetical protein
MANRYPLIYNSNANQLQELQSGDNLDLSSSGISSVGNINSTGIITATSGFNIGIQSGGTNITTGVITAINFVGSGNSISYNSSTKTVDVSISGSSGASASGSGTIGIQSGGIRIGTGFTDINITGPVSITGSGTTVTVAIGKTIGITTQTFFSNPNIISSDQTLNYPNHNYGMFGPVSVTATINVGAGNTFVIV